MLIAEKLDWPSVSMSSMDSVNWGSKITEGKNPEGSRKQNLNVSGTSNCYADTYVQAKPYRRVGFLLFLGSGTRRRESSEEAQTGRALSFERALDFGTEFKTLC